MIIKVLSVGALETNCYLVWCPNTKEAIVIDPGDEGERILEVIREMEIKIKYIVNTHGHHDHIGANKELKEATGAPIVIHSQDAKMLTDPVHNLSKFLGSTTKEPAADQLVEDGDVISFGQINLKVLHTPGHTPGGMCLYSQEEKVCFTGDTIFNGSVGRTDLPGGSYATLIKSIYDKLLTLPSDVTIYPGHGPKSTISEEKAINPFLK